MAFHWDSKCKSSSTYTVTGNFMKLSWHCVKTIRAEMENTVWQGKIKQPCASGVRVLEKAQKADSQVPLVRLIGFRVG